MENFECRNTEVVLEKFQVVTPIFQALGDENRQQIIMLLLESKQMNVTQITDKMEISRPAVSHHLKILRQAELIVSDRHGKEIFYSIIAGEFLKQVKDLLQAIDSNY
ncbi:ArsR family transcriptional regulator [Bacillus cereus]|uniref:ArsR/SmtB family transcription factor n=1 Tax=Bacillus sp. W1 TaxID=539236 RepID=UPI00065B4A69|nr:metalloregulator ArsR/SmtB family transcription factor [Bacillus sp. W1]KMQ08207.1 ArsR family transcriptional regulator [Bacillus cereus]MBR9744321.1 ArsR family transcriptional regulator [Bacillus cereus]MDV5064745.1 metalloregulator ArsR/SmtB family transcription factor [Bacillus sp. W1]